MKNAYENFMQIKLSDNDLNLINEYLANNFAEDLELDIYSKIIIQFENENEFNEFVNDADIEINDFVLCYDFDVNKNQYVIYTSTNEAFDDIVENLIEYECTIFQLIVENYNYIYEPDVDDEDDNLPF